MLKKDFFAVVIYKEDGVIIVYAYKLLDAGIYACAFATPEASFDVKLAGQIDIVINSLKSPVISSQIENFTFSTGWNSLQGCRFLI